MDENETDSNLIHTIKCSWMYWSTAGMHRHGVFWWLQILWSIWAFPKAANITLWHHILLSQYSVFKNERWKCSLFCFSQQNISSLFYKIYVEKKLSTWFILLFYTHHISTQSWAQFYVPEMFQKCFYHEKITALLKFKSITHNWDINSGIVWGYVELFSAAINCMWLCFWST